MGASVACDSDSLPRDKCWLHYVWLHKTVSDRITQHTERRKCTVSMLNGNQDSTKLQKSVPATTIRRNADGKGECVREDITTSQGQEMMRANCKSQREGSGQKKKARSKSKRARQKQKKKEDESKPTDSSKFQSKRRGRKHRAQEARRKESSKTKVGRQVG